MIVEAALLAASSDGRVFGLDQQTLIQIAIQLFNTCILAAFLTKILYKPVRSFMQKRTERINAQLLKAEQDVAHADELKVQYEGKLKDIEAERRDILEAARRVAMDNTKQILEDARVEAKLIRERAEQDIVREQQRVKDEMRVQIIELSSVMAGKFVTSAMDSDTQDRLFSETVSELEDSTWLS